MHSAQLPPAGTAVEFEERPEGFWVRTKVVEPGAVKLVREGVYKGYSIGLVQPRLQHDAVAKRGRIVGGIFNEISLVDYPANPTTKFAIAKRATLADGELGETELIEKTVEPDLTKVLGKAADSGDQDDDDGEDCPTCEGKGKIRGGKVTCPTCRGDGKVSDDDRATKALSESDRADMPAKAFAYVDSQGGRHLPIHDEGHIRSALGRFGQTRFEDKAAKRKAAKRIVSAAGEHGIDVDEDSAVARAARKGAKAQTSTDDLLKALLTEIRKGKKGGKKKPPTSSGDDSDDAETGVADHHEPDGDEDGPDVDDDGDGAKPTADEAKAARKSAAYHLLRLHDATCAAFHADDILTAHPAVERGIPSLVEPQAWASEVAKALAADGGTGSHAHLVPKLGAAYQMAVTVAGLPVEEAAAGMSALRKSFAAAYPDAHPTPTDMVPAKFKRPYVSTGRATQSAKTGQKPRVPLSSHVPSAGDFSRPLITAGHEAGSPGTPSGVGKGRTYYTNAAAGGAAEALSGLHDYIVATHPGICPMVSAPADGEPGIPSANGSTVSVANAAVTPGPDMRAAAVPTPVHGNAPSGPRATKGAKAVKADEMRAILAEALAPLSARVAEIEASQAAITKRQAEYDAQPDPRFNAPRMSGELLTLAKRRQAEQATAAPPEPPAPPTDPVQAELTQRQITKALDRTDPSSPDALGRLMQQRVDPAVLAQLLTQPVTQPR